MIDCGSAEVFGVLDECEEGFHECEVDVVGAALEGCIGHEVLGWGVDLVSGTSTSALLESMNHNPDSLYGSFKRVVHFLTRLERRTNNECEWVLD